MGPVSTRLEKYKKWMENVQFCKETVEEDYGIWFHDSIV